MVGLAAYFLDWIELELPLIDQLTIWLAVGVAIGFMHGLGTGYAYNPEQRNQHTIIVGSGLLLSMLVVLSFAFVFPPNDMQISRNGIIVTVLGTLSLSGLLICMAYGQKRTELKAMHAKETE